MIVVRFGTRTLAGIRLAPSPVSEMTSWLALAATGQTHPLLGDPGPAARFAMRHPDVALIATVMRGSTGYVPDFLTPKPAAGPWSQILGGQLEQVRQTSAEAVATQLLVDRYPGQAVPSDVRRAMEDGTFAHRAANGLSHFWNTVLAADWATLDSAMAADIRRRAWTMATHGVGHLLGSLDPKLRWSGDRLSIDLRWDEEADLTEAELVLSPGVIGWPRMRVQVFDPDNATIMYPVNGVDIEVYRTAPLLSSLVGSTRATILTSLSSPRTTTQLSRAHGLAPSTISHHLSVLVEAGMAAKARNGSIVHYERTERGDALVRDHAAETA